MFAISRFSSRFVTFLSFCAKIGLLSTPNLVQSSYGRNRFGGVFWRRDDAAHAMGKPTNDNDYWYDGLYQVQQHDRGTLNANLTGITSPAQSENFTFDQMGNPSSVVQPSYGPARNMTTMPKAGNWTTSCGGNICERCCKDGTKLRFNTGLKRGLIKFSVPPRCPALPWYSVGGFHSHGDNAPAGRGTTDEQNSSVSRPQFIGLIPVRSAPEMATVTTYRGPVSFKDERTAPTQSTTKGFDPKKRKSIITEDAIAKIPAELKCPEDP